jgi:3-isopropylmalate/(R)-2-methylmalate dehydratase small subunit
MPSFQTLTSRVIPLPRDDVDTDQIIPAHYLKVTDKTGLAEGLFSSWRYLPDGTPDPDFALNDPVLTHARILLAGHNFGCGSSREHAPWALAGWGLQVVISTGFADIFQNNAMKNGLIPVLVSPDIQTRLFELTRHSPTAEITIDLENQVLTLPDGEEVYFPIDAFNKTCLLEGLDSLHYLLRHVPEIEAYEENRWGIV